MKIDRLAIIWTSSGTSIYAEPSRLIATVPLQKVLYWQNAASAALTAVKDVSDKLEITPSMYSLTVNPYQWDTKAQGAVWTGYTVEVGINDIRFTRSVEGNILYLAVTHGTLDTLHSMKFNTLYERGSIYGYSYIRLGTTLFLVDGMQWDLDDPLQFEAFLHTFYSNSTIFISEATIGMENAEATPEEIENLVETYARRASEGTLTGVDTEANVDYRFLQEVLQDMLPTQTKEAK